MLYIQSIICAFSLNLFAESRDFEVYRASSLTEFIERIHQTEIIKKLQSNCAWEIQHLNFPENCLVVFDRQLSMPGAIDSLESAFNQLNRQCQKSKTGFPKDLNRIRWLKDLISLPPFCREQLEIQEKDLLYVMGMKTGPDFELQSHHDEVKSRKGSL